MEASPNWRTILRGLVACAVLLCLGRVPDAAAEPMSRVFLNGVPTPVYFNDGDSFRVLSGPLQGTKARLSGYNTLESFGPVHMWGDWDGFELYAVAKQATLNARRGVWHCESDLNRDGYGRILWWCPDLAADQVAKGLAHAYSTNDEPAKPELLAAQRRAQAAKRGMWAHGVPEFIVTSAHSMAEDPTRDKHYNRAVSALDGHSAQWTHSETYEECQKICYEAKRLKADAALPLARRLLADPELGPGLGEFTPEQVWLVMSDYLREGRVTPIVREAVRGKVAERLGAWKAAGELSALETTKDACHVYVDFRRRFGLTRAECLRH